MKKLFALTACCLALSLCSCSVLEELPIVVTVDEDGTILIDVEEGYEYRPEGVDPDGQETQTDTGESPAGSGTVPSETKPASEHTVSFDENEVFADEAAETAAAIIDPSIRKAVLLLNSLPDREAYIVLSDDISVRPTQRDTLTHPLSLEIYDTMLAQVSVFGDYLFDENDYAVENFFHYYVSALDALREDHYELFLYFDGNSSGSQYFPGYFMPGGWLNDLCDDREAIKAEWAVYQCVIDRIFEKMPAGLTNYEKCCYFAFVIADRTKYDYTYLSTENTCQSYDALVRGQAVCQGYTQAFNLLCQRAGISSWYCMGTGPGGELHAWNRIDTTAGDIYVDVTWYDDGELVDHYLDGAFIHLFMTQDDFDYYGYVLTGTRTK